MDSFDERDCLRRDLRATAFSGFEFPEEFEGVTVPAYDGLWFHDDESRFPVGEEF